MSRWALTGQFATPNTEPENPAKRIVSVVAHKRVLTEPQPGPAKVRVTVTTADNWQYRYQAFTGDAGLSEWHRVHPDGTPTGSPGSWPTDVQRFIAELEADRVPTLAGHHPLETAAASPRHFDLAATDGGAANTTRGPDGEHR